MPQWLWLVVVGYEYLVPIKVDPQYTYGVQSCNLPTGGCSVFFDSLSLPATEYGVHSLALLGTGLVFVTQYSPLHSQARNLDSTQRGAFHRVGIIPAFRASSRVQRYNKGEMGFLGIYRAIYDYTPKEDAELAIKQGDLLYILEKNDDDGWWRAKKKAGTDDEDEPSGLVPNNYVEKVYPSSSRVLSVSRIPGPISTLDPRRQQFPSIGQATRPIFEHLRRQTRMRMIS